MIFKKLTGLKPIKIFAVCACLFALPACIPQELLKTAGVDATGESEKPKVDKDLIRQASALALAETRSLAIKNEIPTITAVGYAAMSTQPSKNKSERRLMAIRAARILAMRQLTEQVHGIKIDGDATVLDAVVQSDTVRTRVSGIIRGARTTRVSPVGTDNYEVAMELDRSTLRNIVEEALKVQK
ncbi:MAG: LPP20 family lipoprotein [Rhodospirillaceae bacterium]